MSSIIHQRARVEFDKLTHQEQIEAVYRMADEGSSDYLIAHATRWAVEQVREVLGTRRAAS